MYIFVVNYQNYDVFHPARQAKTGGVYGTLPHPNVNAFVHLMFLLGGVSLAFGWSNDFALNPARDLAPRLGPDALHEESVLLLDPSRDADTRCSRRWCAVSA
ncbi:hypothetical protein PINS_up006521 [Pythium insidiosum]|nr:hypothetical protein PINS_up006521 [Pythium insidiosum]